MEKKEDKSIARQAGIGGPDEYLTGVSMRDAQKAQADRKEGSGSKPQNGMVSDVMASLVNGISNVPDSLATSIMVGVNPIYPAFPRQL